MGFEVTPESIAYRVQLALAGGQNLPSPCVSVCRMDPRTGWCEGCLRTIDEIAAWGTMDERGRRSVWMKLEDRARHMPTSRT